MNQLVVAAVYKFVKLADSASLREPLLAQCDALGITGTLLLAEEGINGTIAGTRSGIDNILAYLRSDPRLGDLEHKESFAEHPPFYRMKVKLKKEIVTMGVPGIDPTERVGRYVKPEDWNALIRDPDVFWSTRATITKWMSAHSRARSTRASPPSESSPTTSKGTLILKSSRA